MAKLDTDNEVLEKVQGFWSKYSKMITYVGGAVILIAAGWIFYQNSLETKNTNASEAVFLAEGLFDKMASTGFNKDSVNLVLNGGVSDGAAVTGVLKVMNNFSGTPTANRAKYIAGACYLQIKEFDKAIKFLKDFDGGNAAQVKSKALMMLGHAYAEKKQVSEAMNAYESAATVNEKDESITPDALMVCANYAEFNNKNTEAISFLKKLKENFPNYVAVSSGDVAKHLARLGELE